MSKSIPINLFVDQSGQSERRDAAENRARILKAAEHLFAERGVPDVNMADIAEAAAVGKGTLYRRFANKGELCFALMDDQFSEFQNRMLHEMQQMTAAGTPILQQLDRFLNALVFFTEIHIPLLFEVQRESVQENRSLELPHYWEYWTVYGLLQTAVKHGELPADLDLPFLADLLLAPLNAPYYRFQRELHGFSPERISAGLRSLIPRLA